MNKMMSFLAGVLSGLVVGGVAAILIAPASGDELQNAVRSRIQNVLEEAKREQDATEARLRQEAGTLGIQMEPPRQNGVRG